MLLLSLVDRKKGRGRGLFIFFLGLWLGLKGWEVRGLERENGGSGLFSLDIGEKKWKKWKKCKVTCRWNDTLLLRQ
jgi:hypothetical protein